MQVRPLSSAALSLATLLSISLPACDGSDGPAAASTAPAGTRAMLAVLGTTDLHTNVLSYDFKLAADSSLGLKRDDDAFQQPWVETAHALKHPALAP